MRSRVLTLVVEVPSIRADTQLIPSLRKLEPGQKEKDAQHDETTQ